MKLIDRVLAGECEAVEGVEQLRDIPIVLANEVAELYWRMSDTKKGVYLFNQMGPLLPRYNSMWVEWAVPQWAPIDEHGTPVGQLREARGWHQAVLLHAQETDDGWVWQAISFSGTDKSLVMIPLSYRLPVDKEGAWAGQVVDGKPQVEANRLPGFEHINHYEQAPLLGLSCVKLAVLALSLMNCRNVELMDMTIDPRLGDARRKRSRTGRRPVERWRIIRLPMPARRTSEPSEARAAAGEPTAHIVGGHFKTYGAEKPLLGKAVGTYWWGSFLRGSEHVGKIKRIVEVGER